MYFVSACSFQADGDTALYVAAKAGHDEAVRALLEVSATKVNWQNHKGDLPLLERRQVLQYELPAFEPS